MSKSHDWVEEQDLGSFQNVCGWCFVLTMVAAFPHPKSEAATGSQWFQKGESARRGLRGKRDWAAAYLAYQKGCGQKHAKSCWRQGLLRQVYLSRQSSRTFLGQKNKSAAELFQRACRLGSNDGCVHWSRLLFRRGRRERKRALRLLKRVCKRKKHGVACFQWIEWLPSGAKARARSRNRLSLFRQLSKQCYRGHEEACYVLGVLHFKGDWFRKSVAFAGRFFGRACKMDFGDACDFLGLLHGTAGRSARDLIKARRYHHRACELYAPDGCLHLGGLLLRGLGGPKDHRTARRLFKRACQWSRGQGCVLLAEMLVRGEGGDRDMRGAWGMNLRACKMGRNIGCQRADELDKVFFYTQKYKPKKRP